MKYYNLINFGYNPWSDFWKRNQTMFYFISKEPFIANSYFLNQPVWLADLLRNPVKEMSQPKINNWKGIVPKHSAHFKGRYFTPLNFPFQDKLFLSNLLSTYLNNYIFKKIGNTPSICIVNTPYRYPFNFISKHLNNEKLVIYDWSDDFEMFTTDEKQREKIRNDIDYNILNSDVVFCINNNLLNRAKSLNNNSFLIKNATNFFTFDNNSSSCTIKKTNNRPVIGYLGWINEERLDLDLLDYLAEIHTNCDFVFVGPKSHKGALETIIKKHSNVKLLPSVPYSIAPQVILQFDICMLPNKINEHTAGNDPIKIFDYLASGKPIVSTRTAGTENLEHVIMIADDKKTFSNFLINSLREKVPLQARIDIAIENSWPQRYLIIKDILKRELENKDG